MWISIKGVVKLRYKVSPKMRIIAFGCSYTYGHGLSDCIVDSMYPGEVPSKHAFPNLLAVRLGIQCCNFSKPGGSIKFMWHQAMNIYEPRENDIVINMWTNPNRNCVLAEELEKIKHLGSWQTDKPSKYFYKHLENDYDSACNAWIQINSVNNYLKDKVSLIINGFVNYKRAIQTINPKWNAIDCDIEFQPIGNKHPLADDNNHWGPLAHAELSEELYKMIGERLGYV
jgi:hypothetical protein